MTSKVRIGIVTGASAGIGRSSAIALAKTGQWRVVLCGRREAELEKTAQSCREALSDGKAVENLTLVVTGDVSDESFVASMFEKTRQTYGRVDMLFNNAGLSAPEIAVEDLDISTFMNVINVNVTAAVMCTKYAVKYMKEQTPRGGRIINNGSIAAYVPRPGG